MTSLKILIVSNDIFFCIGLTETLKNNVENCNYLSFSEFYHIEKELTRSKDLIIVYDILSTSKIYPSKFEYKNELFVIDSMFFSPKKDSFFISKKDSHQNFIRKIQNLTHLTPTSFYLDLFLSLRKLTSSFKFLSPKTNPARKQKYRNRRKILKACNFQKHHPLIFIYCELIFLIKLNTLKEHLIKIKD